MEADSIFSSEPHLSTKNYRYLRVDKLYILSLISFQQMSARIWKMPIFTSWPIFYILSIFMSWLIFYILSIFTSWLIFYIISIFTSWLIFNIISIFSSGPIFYIISIFMNWLICYILTILTIIKSICQQLCKNVCQQLCKNVCQQLISNYVKSICQLFVSSTIYVNQYWIRKQSNNFFKFFRSLNLISIIYSTIM